MIPPIPEGWRPLLEEERQKPYFQQLERFLDEERANHTVYPPQEEVFTALRLTPYEEVKVLLLGQDPYHGRNQAHGLAFSVRPGVPPPPSLQNIFRELRDDLGCKVPNHGCLTAWAERGVLLLNAVLTVRAREANSHQGKGWEPFTDRILHLAGQKERRVVFLLWGKFAQKKIPLIDAARHTILCAAHPSPYSADNGFFGSRPFSQANVALRAAGQGEIDWQLPDL